jgi:Uma2 family endonuclease
MPGATWDDVARLPEHLVGEIIDGELIVTRLLPWRAARVQTLLVGLIGRAYDLDRCGSPSQWHILSRMETHLGEDVLTPDIGGWRIDRLPEVSDEYPTIAPDWVCEVLTPETEAFDRGEKLRAYARYGVPHVWFADDQPRVEVLHLEGGMWHSEGVYDSVIRSEPFGELEIDLTSFWR